MKVFDVFVNEEKVCRAGVGGDGVLNAIVNWVKLTGAAEAEARRLNAPTEEMRLHVGGLSRKTHYNWIERALADGDRVTIAIATAKRADQPRRSHKEDPKLEADRERRYYERLRKKYEPSSSSARSTGASAKPDDRRLQESHFLNVDLDIWSRAPLNGLAAAFGRSVVVLHVGKERRRYGAHLEVGRSPVDADRTIRRFVSLVDDLPRSRRKIWDAARTRQFNIGVQAGTSPHAYELRLQPATVTAAARIGAEIAFTVYAPE